MLPPLVRPDVWYTYEDTGEFPELFQNAGGDGIGPMAGPAYQYDANSRSRFKWPRYYHGQPLAHIDFVRGNYTPVPQVAAEPTTGLAPLTVTFSSAGTSDPDGDPITYEWDFDMDGTVDSTEPNPTFTYEENGVFDATLTSPTAPAAGGRVGGDHHRQHRAGRGADHLAGAR